jgi:hypothetical protein
MLIKYWKKDNAIKTSSKGIGSQIYLGTITSAHLSAQRSASTHARKDPTRRPETLQ